MLVYSASLLFLIDLAKLLVLATFLGLVLGKPGIGNSLASRRFTLYASKPEF